MEKDVNIRYFIELAYDGSSYNGWQIQKNAPSVQETLNINLSKFLRSEISVTGAGRTDTGVNASYYVAHFDMRNKIDSQKEFLYHINSMLPKDIVIYGLSEVSGDAHARFDAYQREYRYYVGLKRDPFREKYRWMIGVPLDVDAMNRAASYLPGKQEFTAFAKLHSDNTTDECKVFYARWQTDDNGIVFTIGANRFLRNMVRSIVGNLVDVGRGKISPEEFRRIIREKDKRAASATAPARGLFLSDVMYPADIFKRTILKPKLY